MEYYSSIALGLGGLAVFSVSLIFGCFCCRSNSHSAENSVKDNDYQSLIDEIKQLSVTAQEINAEQEVLVNGLVQQFQQLEQCSTQQLSSPCFFKPAQREQRLVLNKQLHSLHSSLVVNLSSYPEFNEEEETKLSYVSAFHQQSREHHAHVGDIAREFNKVFDEYLSRLNSQSSESNRLSAV